MDNTLRQQTGLIVLFISIHVFFSPRSVLALGEYDGPWVGTEVVSVPAAGVTESLITGTILYQTNQDTIALWDDILGSVELVRSGNQWILSSPITTYYMGHQINISSVNITFQSTSYMTGTISLTADGYGGTGSLSHKKLSCLTIADGQTITGISGSTDSLRCYSINLPTGATNFHVQTSGGLGDSDLHLFFSRPPFYNFSSEHDGNSDQLTLASPSSGKWYIGLFGWESYSGLSLSASYDISSTPVPIPDFSASILTGFAPLNVFFTDQSVGSITAWAWNFGDGFTSSSKNPIHTYTKSGSYTVKLTVTGPGGTESETKSDYIFLKKRTAMPWLQLLLND